MITLVPLGIVIAPVHLFSSAGSVNTVLGESGFLWEYFWNILSGDRTWHFACCLCISPGSNTAISYW